MFSSLSKNFSSIFSKLNGKKSLTAKDVDESLHEIRNALLGSDVPIQVAQEILKKIREDSLSENVIRKSSPMNTMMKIVHNNIIKILGSEHSMLNFNKNNTSVVMLIGLQGVGKTTFAGKLANNLIKKSHKKVLLVSLDVHRPAARQQLAILANQASADVFENDKLQDAISILQGSMTLFDKYDVIILDTAGRLSIDTTMMAELNQVQKISNPCETLLVSDTMIGNESVNLAKKFQDAVKITGIVLTRVDGDAHGGAALSLRYLTQCPIKYISNGEKIDDIDEFHPQRIADRILDMGDISSFVEKASEVVSDNEVEDLKKKVQKKGMDFNDLAKQLSVINKLGGVAGMLNFLPGVSKMRDNFNVKTKTKTLKRTLAIIASMTNKERECPDLLNGSRKKRIANGAGMKVNDVNQLIQQLTQMNMMAKAFSAVPEDKLAKMMGGMFGKK